VDFFQAAIVCCIGMNVHDKLFSMMTEEFIASGVSLAEVNKFSLFFTAWFKYMIGHWKISEMMSFARPAAVEAFIHHVEPSIEFLYYLKWFGNMTSIEMFETMFNIVKK
jgi:hypothetical protein